MPFTETQLLQFFCEIGDANNVTENGIKFDSGDGASAIPYVMSFDGVYRFLDDTYTRAYIIHRPGENPFTNSSASRVPCTFLHALSRNFMLPTSC